MKINNMAFFFRLCKTTRPVLRNPLYFLMLGLFGVVGYITYTLNLWGPMIRMANAATQQAVDIGKERLREFLENSDAGRRAHAMAMSGRGGALANGRADAGYGGGGEDDEDDGIPLSTLRKKSGGQQRRRDRSSAASSSPPPSSSSPSSSSLPSLRRQGSKTASRDDIDENDDDDDDNDDYDDDDE
jgi:hypothetical protein